MSEDRQAQRAREAAERQAQARERSAREQLALLDARGAQALRERARLLERIQQEEANGDS